MTTPLHPERPEHVERTSIRIPVPSDVARRGHDRVLDYGVGEFRLDVREADRVIVGAVESRIVEDDEGTWVEAAADTISEADRKRCPRCGTMRQERQQPGGRRIVLYCPRCY